MKGALIAPTVVRLFHRRYAQDQIESNHGLCLDFE